MIAPGTVNSEIMKQNERKTKPELWEEIKRLQRERMTLETFLYEKGLYNEAMEYLENTIQEAEELPFD